MDVKKLIATNIAQITDVNDQDIEKYIEIPPNTDMGDYAFPCFKLAKDLKKAPPVIANEIKEKYVIDETLEKIDVAGGYLNFFINKNLFIKNTILKVYNDGESYGSSGVGKDKTVVIDYSSPNIAKPFHIGHLRTTVIGGALYNIHKFMGYNMVGVNHLGDYGTQFGKLIYAYKMWGNEQETLAAPIDSLLKIYVRFHEEVEKDPSIEDKGREYFKMLEDGDEECTRLWKWFREVSLLEFDKTYKLLNSKFDSYNGEAFYMDKVQRVIDILNEKKLLTESDGAKVVDLEKYEMPPCIVLKSDGATIYATRDLAALIYRMETYNFEKNLYVTTYEQSLHFAQIFKTFELMGYEEYAKKCVHIPYGMVHMKDGKMSTRKGNLVKLDDMLSEAINKVKSIIEEKNPNLDNKEEIAKQIGVGAVIFHDLSNSRIKDEVFDWDTVLNFNGETGPYVQFMYVRTRSILEKANVDLSNIDDINFNLLNEPEAIEIVKKLSKFEEALTNAMEKYEPCMLTRYIIELAQAFSSFYGKYTIMCEDEATRKVRVLLVKQVGDTIKKGMELLGIECPEKM